MIYGDVKQAERMHLISCMRTLLFTDQIEETNDE